MIQDKRNRIVYHNLSIKSQNGKIRLNYHIEMEKVKGQFLTSSDYEYCENED